MTYPIPAACREGGRPRAALPALLARVILALAAALAAAPMPARAQDAAIEIDIARQPLGDALLQLGQQTSLQFLYTSDLVRGLTAPAVHGRLTPEQALRELLREAPLGYRRDGDNVILSRGAPVSQLPSVTVTGGVEPTYGYIAEEARSATKTGTPLAETPQSISVVTEGEVRNRGAQSVAEAIRYTPGVFANYYGSDETRNDWIQLRGFASTTMNYRDGLSQLDFDQLRVRDEPYGLERIEILRGPASVLYGKVAPGGVVNKVSKLPTVAPLREVALQAGSHDRRQAAFDLGGALDAGGEFSYRLTGLLREADTPYEYDSRHSIPDDRRYFAPAFTWRPSAATSLTLLANYQKERSGPTYTQLYPYRVMTGDYSFDRYDKTTQSAGYLFEHAFNDAWTVRQNFRYQEGKLDYNEINDNVLADDGRTLSRTGYATVQRAHGLVVDSQLQGRLRHGLFEHTLLAGLDYRQRTGTEYYRDVVVGDLDILRPVYGQHIPYPDASRTWLDTRETTRQTGVYLQDQVKYDRKWVVMLGGRQDWARTEATDRLADARSVEKSHKFTGRVGFVYLADNGLAPYASYSTSFEPQSGSDFGGNRFVPTTGRQLEAGVKYQPADSQSMIALSVFSLEQQDVLTADLVHDGFSTQEGEVASRGAELEAKAALGKGLDLLASYTFNPVRISKSNYGDEGKYQPLSPKHMASAWLNYALPGDVLAGLSLGVGARYIGKTYVDSDNTLQNGSFVLFDAAVRYETGKWSLAVNATNLFDREVITCRNSLANCRYGAPRSVIATASYRW